jgi:aldehyde:ferredoxin oxidoreductase/ferredoxin
MVRKRRDPHILRRLRLATQLVFLALLTFLLVKALFGRVIGSWIPLLVFSSATLVLTLVLGRVWCGWVCPVGTVLYWVRFKGVKGQAARLRTWWRTIKYILLFLVLAFALLGLLGPVTDWMNENRVTTGIIVLILLATTVGLNTVVDLFWCRYLCPVGGLIALLSRFAPMRHIVRAHCNDCSVCVDACPMDAIDARQGFVGDPSECTVCIDCMTACSSSSNGFGFRRPDPFTRRQPAVESDRLRPGRAPERLADGFAGEAEQPLVRRILLIDAGTQNWRVETLDVNSLEKDPREQYLVLSGEALCQHLLRQDPGRLIVARGPTPFLTGNKATVGYISPMTDVPHYSYIGGRSAAQLFHLGLDAIALQSPNERSPRPPVITVRGTPPSLTLAFKDPDGLPSGQRGAFHWLVEKELNGDAQSGSVLTLGDGAYLGYESANLAAEGIYHAGRGGAGAVFARFASAMVLRGEPLGQFEFFGQGDTDFARNPNREITPLVDRYCHRLSSRTGGTIVKLHRTGGRPAGENTLPAWNAQNLGYAMAEAGHERILKATREGQTGCHWCQVHCRHYHSIPVDYAAAGDDLFLDDFEPAYAIHAMLGLVPKEDTFEAQLDLMSDVDERLMLPVEQMGLDVIDTGLGLAAVFEGVERGIIPESDAPGFVVQAKGLGNLEAAAQALALLGTRQAAEYPALRAVGDGPQALVALYPEMQDIVFTCGEGSLGNPGHCNALWTFLMPFSRFFSHYSGQIYKITGALPPPGSDQETIRASFQPIVERMLRREYFWLLCNAFSHCAFTFIIFSQDGKGEELRQDDLLVRLLRQYGLQLTNAQLTEFAQAFWAQSIDLKFQHSWRPQTAADFPKRVYEALASTLGRPPEELQALMGQLIDEWKQQAGRVLTEHGHRPPW